MDHLQVIFPFRILGCDEHTRQRRLEREATTRLRLSLNFRENGVSLRVFYKVPFNSRLHGLDIWYSIRTQMTVVISQSEGPVYSLLYFIVQDIFSYVRSNKFYVFRELCCDIRLIFFYASSDSGSLRFCALDAWWDSSHKILIHQQYNPTQQDARNLPWWKEFWVQYFKFSAT